MTNTYPAHQILLSDAFLEKYKNKQPNWGFNGLGYIVFKRTYARIKIDGTSEEWWETVARSICGAQKIGAQYTREEAERLFDHMFNLRCFFSGRGLWQLGTETVDKLGMDSLLNCWQTKISDIDDFIFVIMESMLGGGVGCNIAKEFTHELPRVKVGVKCEQKNTKDADYIIPDSKEGWAELPRKILEAYLITGKGFTYSPICIRSSGEPIKTFGGIAPGPKPLMDYALELIKILQNRAGKKLRTQDVADIICVGGQMVKSGGVRRTALILQGDPDDSAYLLLKRWDLGNIPNYRSNSNNSLLCPYYDYLSEKFWQGYNGNGEAYGLLNIPLAKKFGRLGESSIDGFNLVDDSIIGFNPCQPAWATVLTPNGIRRFKDINIGDMIWSKDGWTKITNKWSTGIKEVYRYTTTAGSFYGTSNHRIVSGNNKIEVDCADNIDVVQGPAIEIDSDFDNQAVLDGLLIGDGTVHTASNNLILLCIGENDYDYFTDSVGQLIGDHRSGISSYNYEVLSTRLDYEDLCHTYNRDIPEHYFCSSLDIVASFLRGLYSANGSVVRDRVTLKTSSILIRDKVQMLLAALGIKSYFTTNKSKEVVFYNGIYSCKESYDVNITTDRYKFAKLIGFIQKYKMDKLNDILTDKISNGKQTFDIISKEFISKEEVFDITVDNLSHTYSTGNLNVSNCAEATLSDKECCNLAELAINNISSVEEMIDCAKLLYKTQKAIAAGPYLYPETNKIVHKNMRLGLGITGIGQKLNVFKDWCDQTYRVLRKFDKEWSKQNGWPQSIRLTVIKPSGTLSLLSGSMPGGHPGFSEYFIRRVRFAATDPLIEVVKQLGCKIEPEIQFDGSLNHDTLVAEFVGHFANAEFLSKNCSAVRQLNLVKDLQTVWADQAVSVTVYYKPEELIDIKKWLQENYDKSIKSVSFLLHSEHGFKQAPLEEITKEQYDLISSKIKKIGPNKAVALDFIDNIECAGGACPVR